MSVPVQCPQCSKKFNAKPELAGKRVKCSQCGAVITIPGGTAPPAATGSAARPPAAPGASPQRAAPPQQRPATAAAFDMPAMNSMLDMLADSKLGELKEMPVVRQGEMLCTSCQAVLPMGSALCTKCGLDFRDGKVIGVYEEKKMSPQARARLWALACAVFILIGGLVIGVCQYFAWGIPTDLAAMEAQVKSAPSQPPRYYTLVKNTQGKMRNLSIVILMMGAALVILNLVSMLADAFTERSIYGWLFLFVPGYSLYYMATRWKQCMKPYLTLVIGMCVLSFGTYLMRQSLAYEDAHPEPVKTKMKK